MSDDRFRLGGFIMPEPSTVLWTTVIASVVGYFLFSRVAANLIAIAGGIALTVILVARDRAG